MVVAATRRIVFKPARYAVPAKYGKGHKVDAIFLLALIALLMASESLFEASKAAFQAQQGQPAEFLAVLSLPWMLKNALGSASVVDAPESPPRRLFCRCADLLLLAVLSAVRNSVPRGNVPVQRLLRKAGSGNREAGAMGRQRRASGPGEIVRREEASKTSPGSTCSISIPAPTAGGARTNARPTRWAGRCRQGSSPSRREITPSSIIRCSARAGNGTPLISPGGIYSEDEIWSCTTCGACEEECPLLIEYIDKIVDLRRGMIDDGNVPQSLQKPLKALESRGNPYGKMEKKRAEWTKAKEFSARPAPSRPLDAKSTRGHVVLRRQHHLLRRPHAGDRARHGEDSRRGRSELRHPGRGGKRQRA